MSAEVLSPIADSQLEQQFPVTILPSLVEQESAWPPTVIANGRARIDFRKD